MKFFYLFPGRGVPVNEALMSGKVCNRLAIAAEKAGFYGVGLDQHPAPVMPWLQGPGGHHCFDPFIGLASAAAVAPKLRLLTYLAVIPFYNPFQLTKMVNTLDMFSDGRLILGAGIGYMQGEFEAMGIDFDKRNELFVESLEVFRKASTGDPVDYDGANFTARGVVIQPTAVQRPHPPIWLGGNAKLTRRRVAEFAQGWLPMPLKRSRGTTDHKVPALETVEDLKNLLPEMFEHKEKIGRTDPIDIVISSGLVMPNIPWDEQVGLLKEYQAIGVTGLTVGGMGDTPEDAEDFIRRYGEEVIAKFNG
ncbi:TIGR03619 family F420-dependent LLM class oxidoreductase [Sphingomonas crocodyli]|uniref:TIGR03619 family F420-dependent LLM class oxidoreductase n=1 Tax=Sphingomonas crocodyli TaxID=1979270 RepID=A0A437M0A8_9SPHN|nr:TIGR03619 family F420-dependent LLM class oxidoreductase [Sphingomonas crocodyli]RVT91130.1 TIGR03619 family F420-dependent LLM class oxidoreductase [Sphingomonas crocodyli]